MDKGLPPFTFDGNYENLEQVAAFLPDFEKAYEVVAKDGYPYNDSFRGRVPAIAGLGRAEDTAIYLLQSLKRKREQDAKVAALIAQGYRPVTELVDTTRFRHIVAYPTRQMGGSWAEWRDARLVADGTGRAGYVLPKGRRINGYYLGDRAVLVSP